MLKFEPYCLRNDEDVIFYIGRILIWQCFDKALNIYKI